MSFESHGWCDYCNGFESNMASDWHTDACGAAALEWIGQKIRGSDAGRDFDYVIGSSSSLDNFYGTLVTSENRRPFLFHPDGNGNTRAVT